MSHPEKVEIIYSMLFLINQTSFINGWRFHQYLEFNYVPRCLFIKDFVHQSSESSCQLLALCVFGFMLAYSFDNIHFYP